MHSRVIQLSQKAAAVVSNPPWRDVRSESGSRKQVADAFLLRMVDFARPGGFFGAVVPSSWLSVTSSRTAREQFAERCALYEIGRLPEDVFGSAEMAPAVVIGRAGDRTERYLFRRML